MSLAHEASSSGGAPGRWAEALRALRRAVRPTVRRRLCGREFVLVHEARAVVADRDLALLEAAARTARCILDLGANVGAAMLVLASAAPSDAQVHAVDASERACRLLEEHVALNGLVGRVLVVNALLDARSGQVCALHGEQASAGASVIQGYLGHRVGLRKATLAVDDYVAQLGLAPELVKVDVEGAEARVLAGMLRTLERHRPLVVLELHAWEGTRLVENAARCLEVVRPAGYRMVSLRHRRAMADLRELEGRGRTHVLLLHEERALPAWLDRVDTSRI